MIIIIIPQKKIVTSRHSKYSNQVYTITYALPLCAHPSPRLPPTPQQGHHRSLQDILVTLAHLPAAFPGMFIPISLYTLPILTFTEDILLYFLSLCKIALFSTNFLGCDSKLHSKHHHQYFRVYCGTNESLSLSLSLSLCSSLLAVCLFQVIPRKLYIASLYLALPMTVMTKWEVRFVFFFCLYIPNYSEPSRERERERGQHLHSLPHCHSQNVLPQIFQCFSFDISLSLSLSLSLLSSFTSPSSLFHPIPLSFRILTYIHAE